MTNAKKVPDIAIGATMMESPDGTGRDVKAEQVKQANILTEQQKRQADIDVLDAQIMAAEKNRAALLQQQVTAEEKAAHQAYLSTPLTADEAAEKERIGRMANSGKMVPAELMWRLSDLRIKAKVQQT
jgi:regulator of protease activity HflC (stomatin/prohibitin superfamily)